MDKILIIDDTTKNIQFIATILRKAGYNIAYATTAEVASNKIGQIQFDLILLDCMMPDIDSFEFCSGLKDDAKTVEIPIVFMLPRSSEHNITKAYSAGASDYISKPFNKDEIISRVQNLIDLSKSKLTSSEISTVKEKIETLLKKTEKQDSFSKIDLQKELRALL